MDCSSDNKVSNPKDSTSFVKSNRMHKSSNCMSRLEPDQMSNQTTIPSNSRTEQLASEFISAFCKKTPLQQSTHSKANPIEYCTTLIVSNINDLNMRRNLNDCYIPLDGIVDLVYDHAKYFYSRDKKVQLSLINIIQVKEIGTDMNTSSVIFIVSKDDIDHPISKAILRSKLKYNPWFAQYYNDAVLNSHDSVKVHTNFSHRAVEIYIRWLEYGISGIYSIIALCELYKINLYPPRNTHSFTDQLSVRMAYQDYLDEVQKFRNQPSQENILTELKQLAIYFGNSEIISMCTGFEKYLRSLYNYSKSII